jgi:hypothetical protein
MRAALVLASLAACAPATGTAARAIIGGSIDSGDPAVAYVVIAGGACSGALVAPHVVLTAAHCARPGVGLAAPGTVSFGASTGAFTETIAIRRLWVSRYWQPGDADGDVALLWLASAATATPLPYDAAGAAPDGRAARAVGFGRADAADPSTAGAKRQLSGTITGGALVGAGGSHTCTGDSGGPILADVGAGESIVAVVSAGDAGCTGSTLIAPTGDVPFVADVIAAWEGCALAGTCAPCGLDGTCAAGCPTIDLDCPLGGAPGADCAADADCESRVCLTAPDAAAVRYCSRACAADADCPAPIGACDVGLDDCTYPTGTPGILGAPCDADADCRGQRCDTRQHVCTVPCDGSSCPAGFACGPIPSGGTACTVPDRGCSAGGAPGPLLALLALARVVGIRRRGRAGGSGGARAGAARPGPARPDPGRR